MENENIRADTVELMEFPYLATRYRVMGVPVTVVNETTLIEGARAEARLLDDVLAAIGPKQMTV